MGIMMCYAVGCNVTLTDLIRFEWGLEDEGIECYGANGVSGRERAAYT